MKTPIALRPPAKFRAGARLIALSQKLRARAARQADRIRSERFAVRFDLEMEDAA